MTSWGEYSATPDAHVARDPFNPHQQRWLAWPWFSFCRVCRLELPKTRLPWWTLRSSSEWKKNFWLYRIWSWSRSYEVMTKTFINLLIYLGQFMHIHSYLLYINFYRFFLLLYTWYYWHMYVTACFFYSFYSVLEDVKAIHRDVGRNVAGYISHPINQFHLTRRLYHQWREVLQRILNSDTCVKGKL